MALKVLYAAFCCRWGPWPMPPPTPGKHRPMPTSFVCGIQGWEVLSQLGWWNGGRVGSTHPLPNQIQFQSLMGLQKSPVNL